MAHPNIDERRKYVEELLDLGIIFDAKVKARVGEKFNCHSSAIDADIKFFAKNSIPRVSDDTVNISSVVTKLTIHRFKKYRDKEVRIPEGLCLLAGTNNAGKSTFMQAFAIWEFCRTVIEMEKGYEALIVGQDSSKQGVGIADTDFLPLDLPSLKHLWTNLRSQSESEPDGYTLWLELEWSIPSVPTPRQLRFGLALANNRLFIKVHSSNIQEGEPIPRVAYVPPFAGIVAREQLHTSAMKRRLVGQGLSGAVMRNALLEMYNANQEKRIRLKGDKAKISNTALRELRNSDPWEILQGTLARTFGIRLDVKPFFETYHTHIQVDCWKVALKNKRYQKVKGYNKRDIMVEGSGFLQWLNVLALTLDPENQAILLDEPDAHLHPSLQTTMVNELNDIATKLNKQILFATHSPELIRSRKPTEILEFNGTEIRQLSDESQKISLLAGIGSEYSPRINQLQQHKKVLFVENDSDANLLKTWSISLGLEFPENIVIWPLTESHPERRKLFLQLRQNIQGLQGISLRDRDNRSINEVEADLKDKGVSQNDGLLCLTWRMRYIEGYLLSPNAIAKATGSTPQEIIDYVNKHFAVDLSGFHTGNDIPTAFRDLSAKEILEEHKNALKSRYTFKKIDIARSMSVSEIHSDIKTVLAELTNFGKQIV